MKNQIYWRRRPRTISRGAWFSLVSPSLMASATSNAFWRTPMPVLVLSSFMSLANTFPAPLCVEVIFHSTLP
jgi:hypothetical protein